VPAGIYRTFENTGDEPALLLVVVNITTEEQQDDVVMSPVEADKISSEFGGEMIDKLEAMD